MYRKKYPYVVRFLCFIGLLSISNLVFSQAYPDRPIKWIVPWPPGGGADVVARMIAGPVSEALNQPLIIENKGGAGGNIGAQAGAKSIPDGYTIVFAYSGTHSINRHIYKEMTFEESDFVPIIYLTSVPQLLAVNSNVPITSVKELITLAKASPGKFCYGSSGNGAINHLTGQLFSSMAGVKLLHVPYKGGGPAAAAVVGGEVDMVFGEPSTLLPFVQTGKLRAIATTGQNRAINLPDLPTIAEAGVPGYAVTSWNGVLAPKGTPEVAIKKLNAAFNKALSNPDLRAKFIKIGYEPIGGAPEKFSELIKNETIKWGPIVKESGLQLN
jgi:tripartite-type tricarboxylate transporter receptor subunit TctC